MKWNGSINHLTLSYHVNNVINALKNPYNLKICLFDIR